MNYQKKMKYSFTLGAYPTIELCLKKPQWVRVIYLHPKISPALKISYKNLIKYKNLISLRPHMKDLTVKLFLPGRKRGKR